MRVLEHGSEENIWT